MKKPYNHITSAPVDYDDTIIPVKVIWLSLMIQIFDHLNGAAANAVDTIVDVYC